MGWSCRAEASETLSCWSSACVANSGSSNVFEANGTSYFFEASGVEHRDGAITGSVFRNLPDKPGLCRKAGTFRIEGNGEVTRAPAFLKKASAGLFAASEAYLKSVSEERL